MDTLTDKEHARLLRDRYEALKAAGDALVAEGDTIRRTPGHEMTDDHIERLLQISRELDGISDELMVIIQRATRRN